MAVELAWLWCQLPMGVGASSSLKCDNKGKFLLTPLVSESTQSYSRWGSILLHQATLKFLPNMSMDIGIWCLML